MNLFFRKQPRKRNPAINPLSKYDDSTVRPSISRIPGVDFPTRFRNEDSNEIKKIDTLPKTTGGTDQLDATIKSIKKTPISEFHSNSIEKKNNSNKRSQTAEEIQKDITDKLLKRRSSKPQAPKVPLLPQDQIKTKTLQESEESDDDFKVLNRKKDELIENVTSLSRMENDQKLKILEQQRQLQVQNAKLQDALLVKDSIDSFKNKKPHEYESLYDYPLNKRQLNDFGPKSIISRYEPINQSNSTIISDSQSYDVYMNTYEDLIDEKGDSLLTNHKKSLAGKVNIYENKNKNRKLENHDYEKLINTTNLLKLNPKKLDVIEVPNRPLALPKRSNSNTFQTNDNFKKDLIDIKNSSANLPTRRHSMLVDDRFSFTISKDMYLRYLKNKELKKQEIPEKLLTTPSENSNSSSILNSLIEKDSSINNINNKLKLINRYHNQSNDSMSTFESKTSENALVETINSNFFNKLSKQVPELIETNNYIIKKSEPKDQNKNPRLSEFIANDSQVVKSNTKI